MRESSSVDGSRLAVGTTRPHQESRVQSPVGVESSSRVWAATARPGLLGQHRGRSDGGNGTPERARDRRSHANVAAASPAHAPARGQSISRPKASRLLDDGQVGLRRRQRPDRPPVVERSTTGRGSQGRRVGRPHSYICAKPECIELKATGSCYCLAHRQERDRRIYHQDLEKARARNRATALRNGRAWRLRRKYDHSPEDFDQLLASQGGRCAICRTEKPNGYQQSWSVDHDHKTNKVRGILCFHCNSVLGNAKDSVKVLEAAISYLKARQAASSRTLSILPLQKGTHLRP